MRLKNARFELKLPTLPIKQMKVFTKQKRYRVRFDVSVPDGFDMHEVVDIDAVLYDAFRNTDVVIESTPDVEEFLNLK